MNGLATIARMNDREVSRYMSENPLKVLYTAEDVKGSPDYSGSSSNIFEQRNHVELIDEYFVDSSGLGTSSEPAMTFPSFLKVVEGLIKEHGRGNLLSALTRVGQFQVYVSIFKRK